MDKLEKYLNNNYIDYTEMKSGCNRFFNQDMNYIFKSFCISFSWSESYIEKEFLKYLKKRKNLDILYNSYNLNGHFYFVAYKSDIEKANKLNALYDFISKYFEHACHYYHTHGIINQFNDFWKYKQTILEDTARKKYLKSIA